MVRVEEPRAQEAAQLVASICEALGSVSTTHTRHGGAFLQSSPGAVEVGGLEAESYHQLSREFKASLSTGYPVSQGERGIKEITGGKGLALGAHHQAVKHRFFPFNAMLRGLPSHTSSRKPPLSTLAYPCTLLWEDFQEHQPALCTGSLQSQGPPTPSYRCAPPPLREGLREC